uniref:Phosphatidate cytidylyltransferase n=1 Tax=Candidatus Aschnera chinzeii TaxID=1485666 RepID=A0AAT9G3Z0_9ENTR|nr:MAG: phosphatidate cytidylyltransferase [Candidatus Aschnera chinzeii]
MLIPLVIAALFLLPVNLFGYLIIVISTLAAWEWSQFLGWKQQYKRIIITILFFIILLVLQLSLDDLTTISKKPIIIYILLAGFIWWLIAIILVITFHVSGKLWSRSALLKILFGVLTILPFYCGMLALKSFNYYKSAFIGPWLILYVMLLVWSSDIGAYFFGFVFGKHKLAVHISPGKTFEGMLGGILTSIFVCWLFSIFVHGMNIPITFLIYSVFVVIISVFGDLTESMLKRNSGIKNSSNLIPGHGGILDRIDSLTAAVPIYASLILLFFH